MRRSTAFKDDNCDGVPDEGAVDATLFFIDSDGDGRGTVGKTLLTCPVLTGCLWRQRAIPFMTMTAMTTMPVVHRICQLIAATVDENCDGDPTIGATDVTVSYVDGDGDGQGNALYTVSVCNVPFGYVANSDDCDDTDPDVLSGMPEDWELCNGKTGSL